MSTFPFLGHGGGEVDGRQQQHGQVLHDDDREDIRFRQSHQVVAGNG